ncbi:hypothetical protein ACO1O0_006488 [Amphichorda felina]
MESSENGQPVLEAPVQQSTPLLYNALLQQTVLSDQELAGDDVPPPTYGDYYGEIHDEKNDTGISAHLTDDGRAAIRITNFNRRLSQILTPSLHQHQHVQDFQGGYIPLSPGGEAAVPSPPPLNIVIQVAGSRGDVQPFVVLGKVLKDTYGHRVRLATHPIFEDFVHQHGLEFFSIDGDPPRLMAFMVKNPGFRSVMSGDVGQQRGSRRHGGGTGWCFFGDVESSTDSFWAALLSIDTDGHE